MIEYSERAWAGIKYISDVNKERCKNCPKDKQKYCVEHYQAVIVDNATLRLNCLTKEEVLTLFKIIER